MGQSKRIYEEHQDLSNLGLFDEMIDMDYQYEMWKEKMIVQYEEYLKEQQDGKETVSVEVK
jgi:hypothetical protein